jgi:hypothetical protein
LVLRKFKRFHGLIIILPLTCKCLNTCATCNIVRGMCILPNKKWITKLHTNTRYLYPQILNDIILVDNKIWNWHLSYFSIWMQLFGYPAIVLYLANILLLDGVGCVKSKKHCEIPTSYHIHLGNYQSKVCLKLSHFLDLI